MHGTLVLLGLILLSSIPLIIVFIWFRLAKYQISPYRFLFALLAGATAFFPALFLQEFITFPVHLSGRMALFFKHFIHTALTEELSRFLVILVFFWISHRVSPAESERLASSKAISYATAIGLIAGLGFALMETAVYAASDRNVLPLRIILTTAVHGACGSRIGAAAFIIRSNPFQAIMSILTAIAIHGIFNMLLNMYGFSTLAAAILIAISALLTAIMTIIGRKKNYSPASLNQEETSNDPDL